MIERLTDEYIAQVQEALLKSEKELLENIGNEYLGGSISSSPEDDEENGNGWMRDNIEALRRRVCGNDFIQDYINNRRALDDITIVSSIADIISSITCGISPILVSALIFKRGIAALCAKYNNRK